MSIERPVRARDSAVSVVVPSVRIALGLNRLRNRLRRLLGPIRGERDADDGPA